MIVKCFCCQENDDSTHVNGIYRRGGTLYFCQRKECQELFIEMAGDPPEEEE